MTIQVSPEAENAVQRSAVDRGVSVDELLKRTFLPSEQVAEQDPRKRVEMLLAGWQVNDNTPILPPISTQPGEMPLEALFRRWEEEDGSMTDEEVEAELRSWEEFKQDLDETRTTSGMSRLF